MHPPSSTRSSPDVTPEELMGQYVMLNMHRTVISNTTCYFSNPANDAKCRGQISLRSARPSLGEGLCRRLSAFCCYLYLKPCLFIHLLSSFSSCFLLPRQYREASLFVPAQTCVFPSLSGTKELGCDRTDLKRCKMSNKG